MHIESITIFNHKSLGEEKNVIKFLPSNNIICIVGKNESGKSNIISAFDGLSIFSEKFPTSVLLNCNRKQKNKLSVKIEIKVMLTYNDIKDTPFEHYLREGEYQSITFEFSCINKNYFKMKYSGMFRNEIEHNSEYITLLEKLHSLIIKEENALSAGDKDNALRHKEWLLNPSTTLINVNWDWLSQRYQRYVPIDKLKTYFEGFNKAFSRIVPKLFVYRESKLLNEYRFDELINKKEKSPHKNQNNILNRLLVALHLSPEEFENIFRIENNGERSSLINRFNRALGKLSDDFNKSYNNGSEKISLELSTKENKIYCFTVSSNEGESFNFSERSTGLQWYLELFISLSAAGIKDNALILIDEPGAYLHIDAQKELLELFCRITEHGNQIIYTTHSPSMISVDRLEQIRTIIKEGDISYIRSPYEPIKGIPNQEVLSPITKAIGFSLKNDLSFDSNKVFLIVEGISEYYYLKAYLLKFYPEMYNKIQIFPACGASKVHSLVSLFIGLGYNYRVILDNDKAGHNARKEIEKLLDTEIDNIVHFVVEKEGGAIEDLFSDSDKERYSITSEQKTISAHRFFVSIKDTSILDDATKSNFNQLISRLKIG